MTASRCLFTNAPLSSGTKLEHTILESLGGRITSREVSSSDFNAACGELIDPILADTYRDFFTALAPALPTAATPGKTALAGPSGWTYFVEDGFVKLRGIEITARDEKGQPKTAMGTDEHALRRLGRSMGKSDDQMVISEQSIPEKVLYRGRPVICKELEVAALKCALLSFDHLLRHDPEHRFTRGDALAAVRQFVRDAVVDKSCSNEDVCRYCLGVQVDREHVYARILERLAHVPQPFEHVLIASGNAAQKTLDLIWTVAGMETLAFRPSWDWHGEDFTCVAVSQILRGGTTHGPLALAGAEPICAPNDLRSVPGIQFAANTPTFAPTLLSGLRMTAYQRAVNHVELHCDDHVSTAIAEKARQGLGGAHDLRAAVMEHVSRLYSPQVHATPEFNQLVLAHAEGWASDWADVVIASDADRNRPEMADALGPYRACLADLKGSFGLPGHIFSERTHVELDFDGRPVGDLPVPDNL